MVLLIEKGRKERIVCSTYVVVSRRTRAESREKKKKESIEIVIRENKELKIERQETRTGRKYV